MGMLQGVANGNALFNLQVHAKAKEYLGHESKFSYKDLKTFLKGCSGCTTPATLKTHLRELGEKKMTMDVQVETLLNNYLKNSRLRYSPSDPMTKAQLLNARNRLGG